MKYDLADEMGESTEIIDYLRDRHIAAEFYQALCNMQWVKNIEHTEDNVVDILTHGVQEPWSCSWRSAGGIIADIRNQHHSTGENYIDFYCTGNEGYVTGLVRESLGKLGWSPQEWPDPGI